MGNLPSWFGDKSDKRRQNRTSARQETRRAAETGGKVQPGSGSSWRRPEDVQTPTHLEQLKFTAMRRFPLDCMELEKTLVNALNDGREPRMVVEFTFRNIRAIIDIERTPNDNL